MSGKISNFETILFLFLCVAVLETVTTLADLVVLPDYDPPRIYPDQSEIVITAGRNLTLRCEAKQPITWDLPSNEKLYEMQEAYSVISVSETPDIDYPYGLLLELFNVSAIDVGYYTCLFNNSYDEYTPQEMETRGQAKRIYVYVDDPVKLMVPIEAVVSGTQYKSVIIPCRPTAPNVDVILTRDEVQVTDNINFDPRKGFKLDVQSVTDNYFQCVATRQNISTEHDIYLNIISHSVSVPKPQISDSFNGNAVLGGELILDCYVRVDPGIPFHLKWTYPDKEINQERVHVSNTTTEKTVGSNNIPQKIGKSTLRITNVTKKDSGHYKCEIIDANENTNDEKKLITVLEKGKSFINLREDAGIYEIQAKTGKTVQWIILVNAFPLPQITWFDNHNNEIIAGWSDSHSTKFEVKSSHKDTCIRINKATLADSGIYQLKVSNEYETKYLNLTLIVTAKPTVELDSKKFYLYGTRSSVLCRVSGYPLPKVTWYFQSCSNGSVCDDLQQEITPAETRESEGYMITSIVTMFVNQTGYLTCAGENSGGKANSTSVFYVSDVEDGFGTFANINPIAVGDNVNITCAASVYSHYTGVMMWSKLPEGTVIEDGTFDGVSVIRQKTEYSYQVILSIPQISKLHASQYSCRAHIELDGSTEVEEQQINLSVQDVEAPSIFSTNMNNSEIEVVLGVPNVNFYCRAKGTPVPIIKWYKDDVQLLYNKLPYDKDARINITDNGSRLVFKYIKEEDKGKYKCVASSRVASTAQYAVISIANGENKSILIGMLIALGIIFVILVGILIWRIMKEKQIRKELSIAGLLHFEEGATECLNPELGVDEQAELLPYDKKWEFPRDMLKLGKQLGSGAFGVVMKAVAHNLVEGEESTVVAVKMVKKTADSTFIKALASELKIMIHLGKHLNVVNLLGACTKNLTKRELLVIVEYCRFGNIHNYLLRHRGNFIDQVDHSTDIIDPTIGCDMINRAYSVSSDKSGNKYSALPLLHSGTTKDDFRESGHNTGGLHSPGLDTNNTVISMVPNGDTDGVVVSSGSVQPEWRSNYRGDYNYNRDVRPISTQDLLCWSFQVARGMEYLANRKVLHGDLAARNILLAENNIVKICDFGLAKSMYKSDNYKKKGDGPLPVKWMAIESIRDRVFSTQSDVWSYGIVLWELFSLASTPYPGMEADEKFYNRIIEGYRMEKPQYANKHIYQTMLECWRARPIQRPSFTDLAERLGYLLEDSVKKHYIDLNDPYVDMNSRWIAERGESDYLAMMSSPDYGNLVSATAKHDYVNDPFGGPTRVNPLSPDDTDTEGYLCMSPAKNGVITKEVPLFDFTSHTHKRNKNHLDDGKDKPIELMPMLTVDNKPQRPGSDSDLGESNPASPRSVHSPTLADVTSFANPTYQPMFKIPNTEEPKDNLMVSNDNYVNMSQKDSGFSDSLDTKISPSAFTNPSYVTMSGNNKLPHMYNNVPTSTVV